MAFRLAEFVEASAYAPRGVPQRESRYERSDESVPAHELGGREGQHRQAEASNPLKRIVDPARSRSPADDATTDVANGAAHQGTTRFRP